MAINEKIGDAFVEVGAQTAKLRSDLDGAKGLVSGFADSALAKMKAWALSMGAAMAAAFSFKTLVVDPLKAWADEEKSVNALSAALNRQGATAGALSGEFQALANQIQRTTIYTDDAARAAMTHAINVGVGTDKIKTYMTAAVGLAQIMGVDLETAMQVLIRAGQGFDRQLKMAGISIDETATKEERFATILKTGIAAFGLATDATKTLAGAYDQLKKSSEDARENLGKAMDKFLGLTKAMRDAANAVTILNKEMDKMGTGAETKIPRIYNLLYGLPLGLGLPLVGAVKDIYAARNKEMTDASIDNAAARAKADEDAAKALEQSYQRAVSEVSAISGTIPDFGENLRQAQNEMQNFALMRDLVQQPTRYTGMFGGAEETWKASQMAVIDAMNSNEERDYKRRMMEAETAMKTKLDELVKKYNFDEQDSNTLTKVYEETKKGVEALQGMGLFK